MEILLKNRSEKLKFDCTSLVDSFIEGRRLEFTCFVKKWKEMKFDQIFCGYSDVELPGIVEELYRFAKGMMLHSSNDMQKKTAALFLLYGLHQNQKAQFKIRLTLSEAKKLDSYMKDLKRERNKEAEFVLCKLSVEHAFIFCFLPKEAFTANVQQDESDDDEPVEFQSELIKSSAFHGVGLNELKVLNDAYRNSIRQLFPDSSEFAKPMNFFGDRAKIIQKLLSNIEFQKRNLKEYLKKSAEENDEK